MLVEAWGLEQYAIVMQLGLWNMCVAIRTASLWVVACSLQQLAPWSLTGEMMNVPMPWGIKRRIALMQSSSGTWSMSRAIGTAFSKQIGTHTQQGINPLVGISQHLVA